MIINAKIAGEPCRVELVRDNDSGELTVEAVMTMDGEDATWLYRKMSSDEERAIVLEASLQHAIEHGRVSPPTRRDWRR